jgi:hypothetical protein
VCIVCIFSVFYGDSSGELFPLGSGFFLEVILLLLAVVFVIGGSSTFFGDSTHYRLLGSQK